MRNKKNKENNESDNESNAIKCVVIGDGTVGSTLFILLFILFFVFIKVSLIRNLLITDLFDK